MLVWAAFQRGFGGFSGCRWRRGLSTIGRGSSGVFEAHPGTPVPAKKGTLFLSELTDTFRFQEGFLNELHEIPLKSLPDSPSFPPPCGKTTAEVSPTGHKVLLISFDPEFVPSLPRSITWCNVPGVSNLGCLGIMTLFLISPICQVNSETTLYKGEGGILLPLLGS